MKVIYVVGKYTEILTRNKKKNIEKAVLAGIKMANEGYAVIMPHTNFKGHEHSVGYNGVMKQCYEIIRRVDTIYVCNNWKDSKGSKKEIALAKKLGKEIIWED